MIIIFKPIIYFPQKNIAYNFGKKTLKLYIISNKPLFTNLTLKPSNYEMLKCITERNKNEILHSMYSSHAKLLISSL